MVGIERDPRSTRRAPRARPAAAPRHPGPGSTTMAPTRPAQRTTSALDSSSTPVDERRLDDLTAACISPAATSACACPSPRIRRLVLTTQPLEDRPRPLRTSSAPRPACPPPRTPMPRRKATQPRPESFPTSRRRRSHSSSIRRRASRSGSLKLSTRKAHSIWVLSPRSRASVEALARVDVRRVGVAQVRCCERRRSERCRSPSRIDIGGTIERCVEPPTQLSKAPARPEPPERGRCEAKLAFGVAGCAQGGERAPKIVELVHERPRRSLSRPVPR